MTQRGPFPPLPPPQENALDEGIRTIGKAGKMFFDWITSENDEAFLDRIDAEHGTNARAALDKIRGKKDRLSALGAELPDGPGARHPTSPRSPIPDPPGLPSGEVLETENEVVILEEDEPEPECPFCHGKPVVKLERKTGKRTKMACPTCGKKGT